LEQLQAQFDYVFVATGAHKSRPIGVEGEELSPHIMSGLAMLKKVALGQKLDLGKKVAVIGGGNTAIDAARAALRLGCEVIVVYRRTRNEMPAHEEEVEESRQEGVEFRFLAAPEKIELNNDQSIKKFVCCEMELGEVDQSGRRSPKKIEGKTFNLKVDSIVSAVGEEPLFGYLDASVVTGAGAVRVGADLSAQVKKEGKVKVFAGGDILDTPRTVIHAIGEGKKAAIGIDCLRKGINFTELLPRITLGDGGPLSFALYMGWKTLNENPFDNKTVVTPEKIKYDYIEKAPQMEVRIRPPRERKTDFSPYVETYDKEAALKEAERCMHCGRCLECDNCVLFCPDASVLAQKGGGFRYAFEYDYCKGCVVCAEECPCGVILSKREE